MSVINAVLRVTFDALLFPFRTLHPLIGLTLISLVFGIFALLVFKWTSDQDKLDQVKRRIHAGLFEIRLFNDNLRYIIGAMLSILRHNLTYIRLSLIPLFVMLVPFVFVVAQLQFHYGYEGLEPGETTLVKLELKKSGTFEAERPDVRLEVPSGLRIDAGPVWVPSRNEFTWRLRAEEWGDYELDFFVNGASTTKTVQVSKNIISRRSTVRPSSVLDQILYPAEPSLPSSSPVSKITLDYPHANAGIEGWESEITWLLVFLVLSIVFAFALKKPLGVTI